MKHPITINALRNMMSASSVTGHEAYAVAEKQAHKFLHLSGCTVPSDITPAIEALPKVRIDIRPNMPVSGAVEWVGGYWQILINADEPPTRQRFLKLMVIRDSWVFRLRGDPWTKQNFTDRPNTG